jgi:hypothetical protein
VDSGVCLFRRCGALLRWTGEGDCPHVSLGCPRRKLLRGGFEVVGQCLACVGLFDLGNLFGGALGYHAAAVFAAFWTQVD